MVFRTGNRARESVKRGALTLSALSAVMMRLDWRFPIFFQVTEHFYNFIITT